MADISKIKLPNGSEYDLKDTVARAAGKVSGVKGSAENTYRTGDVNLTPADLGLGTAATHDIESTVNNNTNLPTGSAIKEYVSNHIIVSSTEPVGQKAGDIWVIIAEKASDPSYSQVANESGVTAIIT